MRPRAASDTAAVALPRGATAASPRHCRRFGPTPAAGCYCSRAASSPTLIARPGPVLSPAARRARTGALPIQGVGPPEPSRRRRRPARPPAAVAGPPRHVDGVDGPPDSGRAPVAVDAGVHSRGRVPGAPPPARGGALPSAPAAGGATSRPDPRAPEPRGPGAPRTPGPKGHGAAETGDPRK